MFYWFMDQIFRKFWVPIENANALEYVTMIEFVCFASDRKLFSDKLRKSIRQFSVDDLV